MKFSRIALSLIFCLFVSVQVHAQTPLTTDKDKFSYALGLQLGQNVVTQSMDLNSDALLLGISDMIKGQNMRLTNEEIQQAASNYESQQQIIQDGMGQKNKLEGEKFLAENKIKSGVVELNSGLQYKVIIGGEGAKPAVIDTEVVHYRGTLINGKEFDSSYSRGEPVSFPVNGVIQGWQEALPLMKVGSKWQIFVPANLAYGDKGAGPVIGPSSTLIFDIELMSISK